MKGKPLSSRFSHLAAAGLAAGSLVVGSPSANGQGVVNANETFDWSTTFVLGSGSGTVFYPGAVASGTITLNPATIIPDTHNWGGDDVTGTVTYDVTYNGATIPYTYSDLDIAFAPNAGYGRSLLSIEWNGTSDGITMASSVSSNPDTPAGIQAQLNLLATGDFTSQDVSAELYDSTWQNWGSGSVNEFQAVATPEPGTLALGVLGGAALAVVRLRRSLKGHGAQKTIGLNTGM